MDPAPLFQYYDGGPCPRYRRSLSLNETPNLSGGNIDNGWCTDVAIFVTELASFHNLFSDSAIEGQMGIEKAYKYFS
jgi:hypothetical protein